MPQLNGNDDDQTREDKMAKLIETVEELTRQVRKLTNENSEVKTICKKLENMLENQGHALTQRRAADQPQNSDPKKPDSENSDAEVVAEADTDTDTEAETNAETKAETKSDKEIRRICEMYDATFTGDEVTVRGERVLVYRGPRGGLFRVTQSDNRVYL